MTTTSVFCRQPGHDHGYDVIEGSEVTGKRVATISNDGGGLVLRVDGDQEDYLPDTGAEAARLLADAGYALDSTSATLIDELRRRL